jgi:secreted trypsin-like serine protease
LRRWAGAGAGAGAGGRINTGFTGDGSLLPSNNAATGGTCFGDSGGPNFIGDTNVVAGVTSFGLNGTCAGTGGIYRIDRADDLNWLATFGLTPASYPAHEATAWRASPRHASPQLSVVHRRA